MKEHQNLELWRNAYLLLNEYQNGISLKYTKQLITSHSDYPSLLSLADFFKIGNMEYQAIQAEASHIHEFNYPLLAHIRHPGQEFMHLINKPSDWDRQPELIKFWDGIVIFPEKHSTWHNEENVKYRKAEKDNRLINSGLLLVGLSLLLFSYIQSPNLLQLGFGILSLLGLIISVLAFGTELGVQNEIVKQVCGTVSSGGCEDVLKSKYATEIAGLTPAFISFLYFSTQFIIYFLSSHYPFLNTGQIYFAFAGIGVAIWSIYTQGFKIKKWCALCLSIALILLLQSSILFLAPRAYINYQEISVFAVIFFTLYLFTLPIKKIIKANIANQLQLAELRSWKSDISVFNSLLLQEQSVDTQIWKNDLVVGNLQAATQITIACSPYCGPCSGAHKNIEKLLKQLPNDLRVQFRFLFDPNDPDDLRTEVVKSILQKSFSIRNQLELQEMISNWFEWTDYNKWSEKWKVDKSIDVTSEMEQHTTWVKESFIAYTPTVFINGKKMPGRYLLKDLDVLIPQLAELSSEYAI